MIGESGWVVCTTCVAREVGVAGEVVVEWIELLCVMAVLRSGKASQMNRYCYCCEISAGKISVI